LQALTTLNDPVFFDAARAFAGRLLTGAQDSAGRAVLGFRLCVSRHPSDQEVNQIISLYQKELHRYQEDPQAARRAPASSGRPGTRRAELPLGSIVCNVLARPDETVSR